MAQHAILRFEKRKAGPAGALEAHHERTKEQYASNPDIDTSRSRDNFHIVRPTQKYRREIDGRIKAAGCRTRKDARGGGGLQPPAASGVGHHHAFHVLDDIAADGQIHPLRQAPQGLPGQGAGVGHGDGLGTAQGGFQLVVEDTGIGGVSGIGVVHGTPLPARARL